MRRNIHLNFKEELQALYGDLYDFSSTKYLRLNLPVTIGCKKHGVVNVTARTLLEGKGCPKCGRERGGLKKRNTMAIFLERSHKVHGDKYDYSKVEYIGGRQKVTIICPEHGEFQIRPFAHWKGQGCQKCAYKRCGRKPKQKLDTVI